MNRKIGVAAGVLALGVGLVTLMGFSGGWCGAGRHGHGRDPAAAAAFVTARVEDALDDLDATPDQRARILAVKDRMLESAKALHGDRKETHDALLAEWRSASPDRARLHALVDARAEEMRKLAHEAVDGAIEVQQTLTPEQREKVTRKVERWHR